jgi:hypothetical protein
MLSLKVELFRYTTVRPSSVKRKLWRPNVTNSSSYLPESKLKQNISQFTSLLKVAQLQLEEVHPSEHILDLAIGLTASRFAIFLARIL